MNNALVSAWVRTLGRGLAVLIFGATIGGSSPAALAADEPAPAKAVALDDLPPVQPSPNDWPCWRGLNNQFIFAAEPAAPTRWSATENVIWKTEVPGKGYSSPTIWGDRIFLTSADDKAESMFMLCFDRASGKQLWQTETQHGKFMKMHSKNSNASPTTACDGHYVFVSFIAEDAAWLVAVDFDGKIAWKKRLGDFRSQHGYSPSPVFYKSLVIVVADQKAPDKTAAAAASTDPAVKAAAESQPGDSFIVALHRRSGEVAWRIARPDYKYGNYASPTIGRCAGRDQMLLLGPFRVYSYDPATGKLLWTCEGPSESGSTNAICDDQFVYAMAGYPKRNFYCIKGDGSGDVTATHIVWKKEPPNAYVPSLLLHDGLLYMAEDEGFFNCLDAKTGEVIWRQKPNIKAKFASSPALAGNHIYQSTEAGVVYLFKPGKTYELETENDLADGGFATPIILGGRIYLRTFHNLYCIGKP